MANHTLKKDPVVFQATVDGLKPYEIRLDDRGYQVGDIIRVRETEFTGEQMAQGKDLIYTGREYIIKVTHILQGYGLKEDWVIMSFRKL